MEQTLVLLKHDCVRRKLLGRIISRIEDADLEILSMRMIMPSKRVLAIHYSEHIDEDWYTGMEQSMLEGPLVAIVVKGRGAISVMRKMAGGMEAPAGTIRGDFCVSNRYNIIHASDGQVAARKEVHLWFPHV